MTDEKNSIFPELLMLGVITYMGLVSNAQADSSTSYEYDALGRLITVINDDGSATYSYDAAGNRKQTIVNNPSVAAPASISVPASSTTGNYTISWGNSIGNIDTYQLYEATNSSFNGEVQIYNGTARNFSVSNRDSGSYFYRVRACIATQGCGSMLAGSNGITVNVPIQIRNPTILVRANGSATQITTLANLRGNSATIHSFSLSSCPSTSMSLQNDRQSIRWNNGNYYYWQCEPPQSFSCTATFVIRNSSTGQTHTGNASIIVETQARDLPAGIQCQ